MAHVETTVDFEDDATIITIKTMLPELEVNEVTAHTLSGEVAVHARDSNLPEIMVVYDRHAARIRAALLVE